MIEPTEINEADRKYLNMAIEIAKDVFNEGNYPVGALITINGELIASDGNKMETMNSRAQHAENQLIINNGEKLKKAAETKAEVTLYSTLEPCLMCLGTAIINGITRIVFIQKDPHGGACDIKVDNIGSCYPRIFPEIIEARVSEEPKELIIKFLETQLVHGNKEWAQKVLPLFQAA